MIEYTYYTSGHWRPVCTICQAEDTFDSIKPAFVMAQDHARRCGT